MDKMGTRCKAVGHHQFALIEYGKCGKIIQNAINGRYTL